MNSEIKEITAQELSRKFKSGEKFVLLDVREPWELTYAHITDEHTLPLPMSQIARLHKEAFPLELLAEETEFVVMCHHGVRSANVAGWMQQNGWRNVSSLAGGIDAYANEIDPEVGSY